MPFPPPPPPPGPPPPPAFTPSATPAASSEGRNLLLQSIRQGTTLKKTVTNDKSAPAISGGTRPDSSSSGSGSGGGSPRGNAGINGSATLGRSSGLAGLFAGGMPKLKPTGVDIGQTNNSQSLTSLPSSTTTGNLENNRRQFNVDIKNRGPPPKPPPANQKPNLPQSTSDSVLTGPMHNRSNSTTSLNSNSSWQGPPRVMKAPPGGYGKPNVAPKPPGITTVPGIAAKSPGKLANGRPTVTRAYSMRAQRSPPVAPPQDPMLMLPNQSELYRGAPMFHQSQDSLIQTPPPPKHHTLPSPRSALSNRPPLRPPQTRPPPPPPNRIAMSSPPNPPPPPPPNQAPPPPPHRVPLQNHRILPVSAGLSVAPPPPPARNSSMRNGLPPSFSSKLEARFIERFHVKDEFPPPQPFLGVTKVYNSRTAKQPAPQPPQHVQLQWSRDNTSTC